LVLAVAAVWTVVGLAAAGSAGAALRFTGNCGDSNFECARVTVPLDRSGRVPGNVRLYVERAQGGGQGAVFALAGGPGQGATSITENFNQDLFGRIGRRDLIVVDQRGTGKSGALNCPELERPNDDPIDVRTAACADRLGPRRAHYTTRDSVEDLEAVRSALGVEQITLFGVSYGTKVALGYAMRYPEHVERLVLDSVVEPEGQDPFDLDSFAAIPRVLDEICRGECGRVTRSLSGDVAELVDRMRVTPLRGPIMNRRGRRRTEGVSPRDLYQRIRAGDLATEIRVEYPGAVRSALDGDPAPLVRLEHRFDDLADPSPTEPDPDEPDPDFVVQALSFSLQAATLCEEAPLPWERTASPEERDRQAAERAAAIPDSAFEPFDRETALFADSNSLLFQCRRWPAAPEAPSLGSGPLPDVPVLVLEGMEDTRTPLEVGTRVAGMFPRAQLVAVPKTGHAVLGRGAPCAGVLVRRFFADRPLGTPCRSARRSARVEPPAPARLDAVPPARGTSGTAGRTLAAALLTLRDLDRLIASAAPGSRGEGGLRGGTYLVRGRGLQLRGFSFVPGVRVTGRLSSSRRRTGRLTVSGAGAARGTLTLHRNGVVDGRLGRRQVRGRYRPAPPAG
jgi:pimeloyl-ACP methyl ester carboxylesterase